MKKLICLLLVLLISAFCFASCGTSQVVSEIIVDEDDDDYVEDDDTADDDDDDEKDTSSKKKNTSSKKKKTSSKSDSGNKSDASDSKITIVGSSAADYTVVYPDSSMALKNAALTVSNALSEAAGVKVKASPNCNTDYGIFLSNTGYSGKPGAYSISMDGGDISVDGDCTAAVVAAAEKLAAKFKSMKEKSDLPANYSDKGTVALNTIKKTDSNLRWIGRWVTNSDKSKYTTTWNYTYVTIEFNGTLLVVEGSSDMKNNALVSVDGAEDSAMPFVNGYLVFDLAEGFHSIRIIGNYDYHVTIKNVFTDPKTKLSKPADKVHIQFIGDSITHWYKYPQQCAKDLNCDFSVVAQAGMSLQDSQGWYPSEINNIGSGAGDPNRMGMETNYFKNSSAVYNKVSELKNYDFKSEVMEKPDVIVIFLGTNDYLNNNGQYDSYKTHYLSFVSNLRSRYPDAKIVMLNRLTTETEARKSYHKAMATAISAVCGKFKNSYQIDPVPFKVEISDDGTHPTVDGYLALGKNVATQLRKLGVVK